MQFYNSLTKKIEDFTSIEDGKVIIYVCGLTPYDSAHIGHARTYVAFDVLKRYITKSGYKVYHIQNITDVEDKIIKRCKETAADPKILTDSIHREALELFDKLAITRADVYPKVTDHIPEIISTIESLIKNGAAYETNDGVYYSVDSFDDYGCLSGQNLAEIESGARIEIDEKKKNPSDFALWKKTSGEIIEFDSPWGRGRPGWHIECSAMALKYAGRTLDIHGGARDLIFPHHENEIAQSEAASNQKFCNYWLHTGFLTVEGEKMSKSLGNFITIKQSLSEFNANALRFFFLSSHYRSPVDYNPESVLAANESVERIFNSLGLIDETISNSKSSSIDHSLRKNESSLVEKFYAHLSNDLDTPQAIAVLFSLIREANVASSSESTDIDILKKMKQDILDMLWILGIFDNSKSLLSDLLPKVNSILASFESKEMLSAQEAIEKLIALRAEAKKSKDFKKSDLIRDKLASIGVLLEDGKSGAKWKVQSK
ncbi:MAG: cysteine--tRNA ligase [Candidatus Bilamarchaeum sp.]|jgi:cysteinyl-tRNA synthetase